jgi:signal transduction histidine kinase
MKPLDPPPTVADGPPAGLDPRSEQGAFERPLGFFQVASRAHLADPRTEVANLRLEVEQQGQMLATERAAAERARGALQASLRDAESRAQSLLAEQMRMNQRGSALMGTARRLAGETDADAIYRIVVEVAEAQLGEAGVLVSLCDPSTGALCPRVWGRRGQQLGAALDGESAAASFGAEILGGGCAVSVLADPRYRFDAALASAGVSAITAAPVLTADQPLPVIVATWKAPRPCPREDLWFLEHLAGQMGLALRTAALYSDLRHSALVRQEAEEQLRRAGRLRELGDVAAGVAHAFNNSLTSVLGLADWLLLAMPAEAQGRREIEDIRDGAGEMGALVRRLHDFSRIGITSDAPAMLEPEALAAEVAGLARRKVEERARRFGVELDLVADITPAPPIRGVGSQLRQAWLHLVDNAIESMPAGGQITLRCRAVDGAVRLGVVDDGPGMAAETRARACEPFFSTKGAAHTGIGLTVARAAAERHGGSFELVSRVDNGTSASLVLPAAQVAGPRDQGVRRVLPLAAARRKVLVVDDEEDVLHVVEDLATALGHDVASASSAETALALLADRPFDVVLADVGLPGMSGRELARRAQAVVPAARVYLFTGWPTDADALPPGVTAILHKPVTLHALRLALGAASTPAA